MSLPKLKELFDTYPVSIMTTKYWFGWLPSPNGFLSKVTQLGCPRTLFFYIKHKNILKHYKNLVYVVLLIFPGTLAGMTL